MSKRAIKEREVSRLHARRAREGQFARECSREQCVAIEKYVARHVAPAAFVLHEIRSEIVHVDVHVVAPNTERPYWLLFTTGMSALPMRVPAGLVAHAELTLMLPAWWKMDLAHWQGEPRWFWPIRELIELARYPHRNRTWLGEGHTIANAEPPRPYEASTRLAAMLLLPFALDGDVPKMMDQPVPTELLALWPLHADELAYKRVRGLRALCEVLEDANVTAILDPARPSAYRSLTAS